MSEQKEKDIEIIVSPGEELKPQQKVPLIASAKRFIGRTLSPFKNSDTNKLVEEFTAEMSLVAEGLSEDQARISRLIDNVAASQSTFENETREKLGELREGDRENEKRLKELDGRLKDLDGRLARLEKAAQEKKPDKAGRWTAFVRQLTWLVAIAVGAWIIVTLLEHILK